MDCEIVFVAEYYDKPLSGLCLSPEGETLGFQLNWNPRDGEFYEATYLDTETLKELLLDKYLFEQFVGTHYSYGLSEILREVKPKSTHKIYYDNAKEINVEWHSAGVINLTYPL